MSGSQKVLRVFGILEIISCAGYVYSAIQGTPAQWAPAAVALMTAVFLLQAAKDASKIMPAWIFTLIDVILSAAGVVLAISSKNGMLVAEAVGLVFNIIVFIAANNVKKANR